jgi:3-isopropylmalate dehydrogenase
MESSIAVLPGDGIGPEVIGEAVKVMDRVGARFGHTFDIRSGRVGGNAIDEFGTALPDQTAEMCREVDAILFGAVGGPKWDDAAAKVRPEDGILAIRKGMGLFANLRPVHVYQALINTSPVKAHLLEGVDMMIVRELTGGLYFSKPKKRWRNSRGRRGVDTLKYTEQEIERIVRVGFELARGRRKLLTSADKFNVLESSRLWREVATEVSEDYPDVEFEHVLADNLSIQIIRDPAHFDVIVAENTFGDIISDEASVLSGSLGMLPSASLAGLPKRGDGAPPRSEGTALYEPIHGSAPDIAGQGIANPIGTVLSMAMMLRHSLGLDEEARAVEVAVEGVLSEGYRTPDISADGGEVVSTARMGDVIAGGV